MTESRLSQNLSSTTKGKENFTVTKFISKLEAFVRKLDLLMKKVENKRYGMFELLTTLANEHTDEFSKEIVHHLSLLKTELKHYFLDMTFCAYIANPFFVDPVDLSVGTAEQRNCGVFFL